MTILVTGGAGYVGSHFVLACLDAGRGAVVVDDLSTGRAEALPRGVPLVVGDCGDHALLARVWAEHRIEAVVHFAARVSVPGSVSDPSGYYMANVSTSASLLSFLARRRVAGLVFSSTAAVYGAAGPGPIPEGAPCRPQSPYGRGKLMVEQMLGDLHAAHGTPHACLRYFNVAGADPARRAGQRAADAEHLIARAVAVASGHRAHLDVYGTDYDTADGTCVRDFIHVSDLAAAHLAALDHLARERGALTLNVGTGRGVSVAGAAAAVARAARRPIPLRHAPRRPGDVAQVVADPSEIGRRLGWRPERSGIDEIVASALAYEMSRRPSRAA